MSESLPQYKKRVATAGGRANVAKNGAKHMSKIGKKGMARRWKKK